MLIDAGAWDQVAGAVMAALSAASRPVARDVLADWFSKLPDTVRSEPSGQLLAAVASSEDDPEVASQRMEAAAAAFRDRGDLVGEPTCLVQLGLQAWWLNDTRYLGLVATRVLEMDAAGCEAAGPFVCVGRALMYDMADDSRQMLAKLRRIPPAALDGPWLGIVGWLRSIALVQLGHTAEALDAADHAIACSRADLARLIESTRLQAVRFQGRSAEVLDALPEVVERMARTGSRHHLALAAGQASVAFALNGETGTAITFLNQARASAVDATDAPLVETVQAVAEAMVAVVSGDEAAARAHLGAYLDRYAIGSGTSVAVQRRYLPLFYVLVPETRPAWERMDLAGAWHTAREIARAVVGAREERRLVGRSSILEDHDLLRAHLPPVWIAELALTAVGAARSDGWRLLDTSWPAMRPAVADIAIVGRGPLRQAATAALGRLPVPPVGVFELRLLGPTELRCNGELVDAPYWGRDRVRSLLIYLVLHRTVSRTRLTDDLWPDLPPEGQSRNLRVTFTYLLQVLEPGRSRRAPSFFVRPHGNNLVLHPDRWLTVDLWDFDERCERAAAADRIGLPGPFLDAATQALALWRGEPTDGLSSWTPSELEQRRLRFVITAVRAGELHLARNHIEQARDLAERALAVDPWIEAPIAS